MRGFNVIPIQHPLMKNETTVRSAIESSTVLGKSTDYVDTYNPSLLYPISRKLGREDIGVYDFEGFDLWRLYEITWLSPTGLPQLAVGTLKVPATSPNIVESKSLKLYVGSFTQSTFASIKDVEDQMTKDISDVVGAQVEVTLSDVDTPADDMLILRPDTVPVEKKYSDTVCTDYDVNAHLLDATEQKVKGEIQTVVSNLLRSRCPVTGQPDHASVIVRVKADKALSEEAFLKYVVSFRHHQGFHEQCCEQIFTDLKRLLAPEFLEVKCCFTRRGGIDISPVRALGVDVANVQTPPRTIRQ